MSIRRNSLFNLAGKLAPIAITLLMVPPYLRLIGEERYGVLTICWTVLGYFGLFDLGLNRATAHRMATLSDASDSERGELLWTVLLLNAALGALAAVLFWYASRASLAIFMSADSSLQEELWSALPWLTAAIPLNILSSALSGGLQGRGQFLALNAIQVLGMILAQILPLSIAALHSPNLDQIIPAVLVARLVTTLIMLMACRHYVPLNGRPRVNLGLFRSLSTYGGWISVSSLVITVLFGLERVMIGAMSGAKAVTYYSVPETLVGRIRIIPAALSNALFPRFAVESHDRVFDLKAQAVQALAVVMTLLTVGGSLLVEPILAAWISTEFARQTDHVAEILLLGVWTSSFNYVIITYLQARGRPEVVAKSELLIFAPYVALLYFALVRWGVYGAALAWLARTTISPVMLIMFARMDWALFRPLLFPACLIGIATLLAFTQSWTSAGRWVSGAMLLCATTAWAWLTAPPSVKQMMVFVRGKPAKLPL